ncbi:unnamed protein product [Polarella glacialis]|uniref:Protein kinase domain-containing protein n=1 Tax=Polarella glacialis TaxID=89957 RepID=A0A813HIY7_POLGL|nr:unnamed protein product [Polarella glacialis]CAE8660005.1 unnamed protein product [Polarella glacialis]
MARKTRVLGGSAALGAAAYAGGSLFVVPRLAGRASPGAQVQATSGRTQSSASASAPSALSLAAGAAGFTSALLVAGLQSARRSARRSPQVATKALGSIEQFKVFGPEDDPFEIQTNKVLGVGGQGTVYACHRQKDPSKVYAVKTIPIWRLLMDPSSAEKIAAIEKEVEVLMMISGHPNIAECIGCYDAFRPGTAQAQYKMMVMELIPGGELAEYVKDKDHLDEAVAKNVLKQTCEGLRFIHSKQVLHRDLKCENILVCSDVLTKDTKVKLIDFGVAKVVANTFARSCVGTTEIMAPELICAKLMIAAKGVAHKLHGPITFKSPREVSPGFGIKSQRPDGKGAMINGIEPGGQAEKAGVGDGWAITAINGDDITGKPFVKDFNEMGAGSKVGVKAIAEILGTIDGDFTMDFVELPKREFSTAVDLWSLGVVLYTMLAGKTPFKDEDQIANGEYLEDAISHTSAEAKDLISKLLSLDPRKRPNCDEVLAHPWLANA